MFYTLEFFPSPLELIIGAGSIDGIVMLEPQHAHDIPLDPVDNYKERTCARQWPRAEREAA